MKVVVTGAAGYLGRHVVEHLLAAGHEVVAVHRAGSIGQAPSKRPLGGALKLVELDLARESSVATLSAELGSSVGLVHLAALRPAGETDASERERLFEVNVLGTLRVLEAARKEAGGASAVVYACDAEVYGRNDSELPLDEEARLRPLTDYAACKLSGEDHLFAFEFETQTRCLSLRFGALYGPGQKRPDQLSELLASCARSAVGGPAVLHVHPDQVRPRLDVRDAAITIEQALTSVASGRFNIADGQAQSRLQEARLVFEAAGRAGNPVFAPPSGPASVIRLDLARARNELGFSPKYSLADALSEEWRSLQS